VAVSAPTAVAVRGGSLVTTGDEYEAALRSLPEAYSLALRLQDAGVTDDVICEYLHIEPESLSTLLEMARRKLNTAIDDTDA
jgi:DNA-directed RNA polymerase specialized sigma24 family protein